MMTRVSLRFGVVAAGMLCLGFLFIAQADNSDRDTATLVHVGKNPNSCGTIPGTESGVANVRFDADRKRLKVNISVYGALPKTTYGVDIRCVGAIGNLTTDSLGAARAQIDLSMSAPPSSDFFIDISVFNGVTYGDTFIAGPFNLN
jgi:hypothetical protein